jgi:hypothetical protein
VAYSSYAARPGSELPPSPVSSATRAALDEPAPVSQQQQQDLESSRLVSGGVSGDSYSYQAPAVGGGVAAETVSGRVEEQLVEPATGAYEQQQYEESVQRPGYEPQYEPPEPEQPAVQQQEPTERAPNKTLSRGPSYETVNEPQRVVSRPPSGGSSRTPPSPTSRGRGVKQP